MFALPGDAPGQSARSLLRRVELPVYEGWSCRAHSLPLADDTIRGRRKFFEQSGIEGLAGFDAGGSASYPTARQEHDLKAWASAAPPRSTGRTGVFIKREFGLVQESRSGLIALLHRLGLAYHKPDAIPRKRAARR
ncbi:MAG: hypothetical protein ACREC4_09060 [Methylocella sp.]